MSGSLPAQRPAVAWGDQPLVAAQALGVDGHRFGVLLSGRSVNVRFLGDQLEPAMTAIANGCAAVAWTGQIDRDKRRIFLRLLEGGAPTGEELRASTVDSGSEVFPSVAATSNRIYVAWQRVQPDGGEVFVRSFDSALNPLAGERRLCEGIEPVIAAHNSGAVAAFTRALPNGTHRVHYQLLDTDLRPVGPERSLPLHGLSQNGVTVAARADGSFALAWAEWSSLASPVRRSAYVARFDPRGVMLGASRSRRRPPHSAQHVLVPDILPGFKFTDWGKSVPDIVSDRRLPAPPNVSLA